MSTSINSETPEMDRFLARVSEYIEHDWSGFTLGLAEGNAAAETYPDLNPVEALHQYMVKHETKTPSFFMGAMITALSHYEQRNGYSV